MRNLNEQKIGGISLIVGTLLFLGTVAYEYKIGWIGLNGGPEEARDFIRSNWPSLETIWFWQMAGGILVLLSYLLFFKITKGLKSALWALLSVGALFSTTAFLLTLGSYAPALKVYDSSPELFEAIRGGIASLYASIRVTPLFLIWLFCLESFGKNGMIGKKLGSISLGFVISLIAVGVAYGISVKVAGLPYFILPLVLGYSAVKKKIAVLPAP